jgi:putative ABC transport system ATP-binding protein
MNETDDARRPPLSITPALSVRGVHHSFRGGPDVLVALRSVDLTLEAGDFVVVVGPNGSGKSTLLDVVAGNLVPNRGSVYIDGHDVTGWPAHRRARLVARVFQDPSTGTAPHLTVAENLAVASRRSAIGRRLRRAVGASTRRALFDRVAALGVHLEDRLDSRAESLSGGQRQMLSIVMATLARPSLLLLDEHTAALDPRSAEQVFRLTCSVVSRERLTTLMVTHSMQEAAEIGNRVIMMHEGRIVHDFAGARRERLRVQELLDRFDELRNAELLDDSAAELLRRQYV